MRRSWTYYYSLMTCPNMRVTDSWILIFNFSHISIFHFQGYQLVHWATFYIKQSYLQMVVVKLIAGVVVFSQDCWILNLGFIFALWRPLKEIHRRGMLSIMREHIRIHVCINTSNFIPIAWTWVRPRSKRGTSLVFSYSWNNSLMCRCKHCWHGPTALLGNKFAITWRIIIAPAK